MHKPTLASNTTTERIKPPSENGGGSHLPGAELNTPKVKQKKTLKLQKILNRPDIWQGQSSRFTQQPTISSGYSELDQKLNGQGLPEGSLIEVCSKHYAGDWLVFHKAARDLMNNGGLCALIQPPSPPFAQGLAQLGIPLEQLLIITPENKADLIACVCELAQLPHCHAVLTWNYKYNFTYAELRKIHLASLKQRGIYILFRAQHLQQQSSPATLRLTQERLSQHIRLSIFKQRGQKSACVVELAIPEYWQPQVGLNELSLQGADKYTHKAAKNTLTEATVIETQKTER